MGGGVGGDSQTHKKRKLGDHRVVTMGEQTERTNHANGTTRDYHNDSTTTKQRLLKLLEPFSREQLLDILVNAAAQHDDVYHEIKAAASTDVAHRKVFVRGLAWETTSETLTSAFAVFGEVEEGAVIFDKGSGKSRGYGFVTFVEMDGAQRAIEKQSIEIDGRRATCNLAAVRAQNDEHQPQYASPGNHTPTYSHHTPHAGRSVVPPTATAPYTVYTTNLQPPPAPVYAVPTVAPVAPMMEVPRGGQNDEAERKLFVRGLSWDTTDESLRAEFIKHGELIEASVVRDRKTGKSKGFGFVTFCHRGAAVAALQQPHKVIDGRSVTCNLASLGRTAPPASGVAQPQPAPYQAPPAVYPAPQQPDMGGYVLYAQPPPTMTVPVDPYHQQAYAYAGAPPPLPPTQQYYYPSAPLAHPTPQGHRQ